LRSAASVVTETASVGIVVLTWVEKLGSVVVQKVVEIFTGSLPCRFVSPFALAFNKERKVKLSASNGSDVVIKSGVIEKELVVAIGSNIVVGGMAVVVLIVEVVGGRVEVNFWWGCRRRLL
jgi:hypothetical protein